MGCGDEEEEVTCCYPPLCKSNENHSIGGVPIRGFVQFILFGGSSRPWHCAIKGSRPIVPCALLFMRERRAGICLALLGVCSRAVSQLVSILSYTGKRSILFTDREISNPTAPLTEDPDPGASPRVFLLLPNLFILIPPILLSHISVY